MTLTEFLLARIAEDEADPWRGAEMVGTGRVIGAAEHRALREDELAWEARVFAECEAKRRIVADHHPDDLCVSLLATVYADHPDYCEEWKP